jgi:hypothetical protein
MLFTKPLEQGGEMYLRAVAVDAQGALYVAGAFHIELDFDPGPGTDVRRPKGYMDAFVSKFDPQGSYQWARTWGSSTDTSGFAAKDDLAGITLDPCGSPLVVGSAPGSFDIDPGPGEDMRPAGAYLSKLDASGSLLWARSWASPGTYADPTEMAAVTAPPGRPLFISGMFNGKVDFGLGGAVDIRTSAGQQDAVLMRLER